MSILAKQRNRKLIVEIICWVCFGLFVYAAISKLLAFDKFKVTIGQSTMLTPYAGVLAWLVPVLEIVIAVMVQFNRFRALGLYAFFSLMTMFTTYIFIILQFNDDKPCACGGLIEAMGWSVHFIFNISFVVLGVMAIVLQTKLKAKTV